MPVPKRKTSKARRDQRSAGKKVKLPVIVRCQTCDAPVLPHQVCKECGHYKGVKVINTKTDRMYERSQSRQTKQQAATPNNNKSSAEAETAPSK